MRITNSENKQMSVGTNWQTGGEIIFNFSSFTFPSCAKCNTDFATNEALVKPTVEKILVDEYVDTNELVRLLDWFDKVRVGLWLGIQFLNKGAFNMEPKYFVNTRVRLKDRMLSITNCYDNYLGLRWTGANTLCFIMNPTCVTLKVNNVIFSNCSSDFVLSRQLGFPYPIFERPNPNSHLTDFLLVNGKYQTTHKLFKSGLYLPSTIISQPIFTLGKLHSSSYYNNDYVKGNSYDFDSGIGKVFVTHDNKTYAMEIDEEISFANEKSKKPRIYKLNRPTLEFQMELLLSKKYNLELLDEEQKEQHHQGLRTVIDYTKEQIKQYDY